MKFFIKIVLFFSLTVFLVSCDNEDDFTSSDDNPMFEETYYNIEWNGEPIDFSRFINGAIPGGAETQIFFDNEDFSKRLFIRWGRIGFEGDEYDFDSNPSVSLKFIENGEEETYLADQDFGNLDIVTYGTDVVKAQGQINLRPFESIAQENNPDGGVLTIDVQKATI